MRSSQSIPLVKIGYSTSSSAISWFHHKRAYGDPPALGFELVNFPFFIIFLNCLITESITSYGISCSYLTGVTTAKLRWHLTDINVIHIHAKSNSFLTEKLMNRAQVNPTSKLWPISDIAWFLHDIINFFLKQTNWLHGVVFDFMT